MTPPSPKVSVCVPVRNSAATLRETLLSLRAQDFRDLEIVVVDNNSDDGSAAIAAAVDDPRIRTVVFDETLSAERNCERAIANARGRYIAIFHGDDVYEPSIVSREAAYLDAHPEAAAVFTRSLWISSDGRPLRLSPMPAELLAAGAERRSYDLLTVFRLLLREHNFLVCPSAMVRAEVYRDPPRRWSFEGFGAAADLGVWLGILERHRIGVIPEPLMRYRHSSGQQSALARRLNVRRADFFKVLDHYLSDSRIRGRLGSGDRFNLELLEFKDRCVRAVNLVILRRNDEARRIIGAGPLSPTLWAAVLTASAGGRWRHWKWLVYGTLIMTAAWLPSGATLSESMERRTYGRGLI